MLNRLNCKRNMNQNFTRLLCKVKRYFLMFIIIFFSTNETTFLSKGRSITLHLSVIFALVIEMVIARQGPLYAETFCFLTLRTHHSLGQKREVLTCRSVCRKYHQRDHYHHQPVKQPWTNAAIIASNHEWHLLIAFACVALTT